MAALLWGRTFRCSVYGEGEGETVQTDTGEEVVTSDGEVVVIPDKADFGSLSSGGLY